MDTRIDETVINDSGISTLPELISHLESIDESEWCIGAVSHKDGRSCALGHINVMLHGDPKYRYIVREQYLNEYSAALFLKSLGIVQEDLVAANNYSVDNPKKGALDYLKSKL